MEAIIADDKTFRRGGKYLSVEMTRNRKYHLCFFHIQNRSSFKNIMVSFGIPWVCTFYLKFKFFKLAKGDKDIFCLDFHNSAFWWKFWINYGEWHSSTPKWRHGSFHFDDFFLGKTKHFTENEQVCDMCEIRMPEGIYHASVKTWTSVWKRSRWFTKRLDRIELSIESGIPIEGKGENSWDCGMDCVFSSCFERKGSVEDAANEFTNKMMKDRERRGGNYSLEALAKEGYFVNNQGYIDRKIEKSYRGADAVMAQSFLAS